MKKPNITEGEWVSLVENTVCKPITTSTKDIIAKCNNDVDTKAISAVPDMIDEGVELLKEFEGLSYAMYFKGFEDTAIGILNKLKPFKKALIKAGCTDDS